MGKKLMYPMERGTRSPREQRQRPAPQGITRRWPELRVVRFPDTDSGQDIDDWHIFLDDIGGSRNYGKGKARALGSMAITYISAKEFGLMLEAKYGNGKDYNTPEKATRLVAKMRTGMSVFMRDAHMNAYNNRTDTIYDRLSSVVIGNSLSVVNELEDSSIVVDELTEFEAEVADVVVAGQTAPIWFDAADLAVKGLGQYGEGYGLDLSLNPVLFEERQGMLEYLRTYEKLDTARFTNAGWMPHATVFEFEDHIRGATVSYGEPLPGAIPYNHPVAF
jgi:hypothetical protein